MIHYRSINPFQNKPWFLKVCSTSLLKKIWEKEKLRVMSNFSFSHSFSTCFENFWPFSSNLKLSTANSFQFGRVKNLLFGKNLSPLLPEYGTSIFRELLKACLILLSFIIDHEPLFICDGASNVQVHIELYP